jgi:hypothetical protein
MTESRQCLAAANRAAQAGGTALAGANGGGALDADGANSSSHEFAFTEWAPGAKGDMEALAQAFDTNNNGLLDAGDARFSEFRRWVDGELVTLNAAGIASISLKPKTAVTSPPVTGHTLIAAPGNYFLEEHGGLAMLAELMLRDRILRSHRKQI